MIPVPSIEIQNKISNFLNLHLELISQLTCELQLRKQQYEHYKEKLISQIQNTKTIEEIATQIYRGNGVRKEFIGSGNYPYIVYGELYTKYGMCIYKPISSINPDLISKKKYCEYGDLLITLTGENPKEIATTSAYLGKDECIAGWGLFVLKHNQNPKYLAYALSTSNVQQQKQMLASNSTMANITADKLKQIKIPLPPLEVQERIVNILDKFRKLCEYETGIAKEIEMAKKQYECYRDLLIIENWIKK